MVKTLHPLQIQCPSCSANPSVPCLPINQYSLPQPYHKARLFTNASTINLTKDEKTINLANWIHRSLHNKNFHIANELASDINHYYNPLTLEMIDQLIKDGYDGSLVSLLNLAQKL
jgi:hypothetical protein